MGKTIKETIHANGYDISIYTSDFENEFISLTDIARYRNDTPHDVIKNWLRSRETLEFLGLWERLHNPDFKQVEFDLFRSQAGLNAFTMSPQKWIEGVGAIGMISKAGRYGGTYAHSDIAFEFASWVSAEFKLYIIKDYKRLKNDENSRLSLIYSCLYSYADRWLFAGSTENQNESILAALIRRIIQNPVYCGKISYDRRRTEKVHGTRNEYRQV